MFESVSPIGMFGPVRDCAWFKKNRSPGKFCVLDYRQGSQSQLYTTKLCTMFSLGVFSSLCQKDSTPPKALAHGRKALNICERLVRRVFR